MSFDSILETVLAECPGALGAALLGSDGVPIAQATSAAAPEAEEDVSVLGIEFGRVLDEARKAAAAASAGALQELAVRSERFHLLLQVVDRETYLVLALGPDANVGKGRYLLRRYLLAIREQL